MGVDTETPAHPSVALHVLRQPVFPVTFRKNFVYPPPGDFEALVRVGDVPRGVEVLVSVCDPLLRYS